VHGHGNTCTEAIVSSPRYNTAMSDVTRILSAIERGDEKASDKLLPLVYQELRKLAAAGGSIAQTRCPLEPHHNPGTIQSGRSCH
jgi:hypothetical protein